MLLFAALLGACDGEEDGDRGPAPFDTSKPPDEQCRAIAKTICDRERTCSITQATAPCTFNIDESGVCARATAVEPAVADCHRDLNALSCASLFPQSELSLPNSCLGLFTFAKTGPEMQCEALAAATCQRAIECSDQPVAPEQVQTELAACAEFFALELDCFAVTSVTANYTTCLSKTQTLTCAELEAATITECVGVLSYQ